MTTAARRAVLRWSWRLFKREWRQQLLVLALVVIAVAGTAFGLGFATNAQPKPTTTVSLPGSDPQVDADIAAITALFGGGEVIRHQSVALPGSLTTLDVRSQDLSGRHPTVRLIAGRFPTAPDEVALTGHAAALLGLHIGDTWAADQRPRHVVGQVENPENLDDQFGLVPVGAVDPVTRVAVLVHSDPRRVGPVQIPSGLGITIEGVTASDQATVAVTILAIAALGLLFVALVAVAGFAVIAQRHLRALGMLGSLGATDRHTRLVLIGDGAAVGIVASAIGLVAGVGAWLAFAPHLEVLVSHRINRFDLPWWALVMAAVLAVLAATGAAWWPSRSLTRVSIIEALSGRPPRPRPARSFAAAGLVLAGAGTLLLVWAHSGTRKSPPLTVSGIVIATVGVLLFAPLAIVVAAKLSRRLPVAPRLALRDLGRYQARAGAALGAVTLALAIATTISIAAAYQHFADGPAAQNLPTNELVVYLSPDLRGGPMPDVTSEGVGVARQQVDAIAASVGDHNPLPLERALDPNEQNGPAVRGSAQSGHVPAILLDVTRDGHGFGMKFVQGLYVATPQVLARLNVRAGQLDPATDVVMSRTTFDAIRRQVNGSQLMLTADPKNSTITPKIQTLDLPVYTSEPTALITAHGLERLGLRTTPAAWLITAGHPLADAQVAAARKTAAAAGLAIETREGHKDFSRVGNDATAIGILFALGVLAVTVGLIRAESAHELRTLTATGAAGRTRRALTGVTAATLGFLGAILGVASAYLTVMAWYHAKLSPFGHPPAANLLTIGLVLPVIAGGAGFLLAGREPPAIARRPLD